MQRAYARCNQRGAAIDQPRIKLYQRCPRRDFLHSVGAGFDAAAEEPGIDFDPEQLMFDQPQLLGAKISADSSVTWGIPMGVGLILSAFVLTGIYVRRANGEFDRLNQEILKEAQQ